MNVKRSVCFGILFLLKASFAQSAPHSSYPDEDEEALIDKLASFAAAVGPEAFLSKQQVSPQNPPQSAYLSPQNYDLASYLAAASASGSGIPSSPGLVGEWGGPPEDPLITRESLLKLPRQFGYKPTDIRFYLPAEQFPNPNSQLQSGLAPQQQEQEINLETNKLDQQPQSPLASQLFSSVSQQQQPIIPQQRLEPQQQQRNHGEGQSEFVLGDDKSDFYFMKKKEQAGALAPDRNPVPGPSHIMASEHSVNGPGYSSRQVVEKPFTYRDMYYIALVAGVSAAAVVGLIAAGICYYRIHERIKAAADVDYPAYGVTGPSKDITPSGGGDRKLAQSAQMYHYQHQKQQMAALQKGAIQGDRQGSGGSDVESDDDNEDGDYTVYECPGLAPAGEMEVKNPLFHDEQTATPATPNTVASSKQQQASSSQDSCSSAPESASSSASSTATITSSTPKITESPNTPPPAQEKALQPEPEKSKPEKKGKGKAEKK